jgi:hypothetical protein
LKKRDGVEQDGSEERKSGGEKGATQKIVREMEQEVNKFRGCSRVMNEKRGTTKKRTFNRIAKTRWI